MEIKKGDVRYTISERSRDWNVTAHISDTVGLNYVISKGLCPTYDEVVKYINENDEMFAV